MKIGLDVSGGDFAPQVNLQAALQVKEALGDKIQLVLFGDQDEIQRELSALCTEVNHYFIVHCPEKIDMAEHPIQVLKQKPQSSIARGLSYIKEEKLDAFASTGNTGAMMVGALQKLNIIPGIIRPCISAVIPCINGKQSVLLDVGANADCRVDVLCQFAELGSIYAESVLGIQNPRVGLVNIGKEESKGNLSTQAAFKVLNELEAINFIGNVEGRDLFTNEADVLVCDGFTGNIILKQAEGFYSLLRQRGIKDAYFEQFNYENYGGTPILGVRGNVFIGHGSSNASAVAAMLTHAYEAALQGLSARITKAIKE